MSPLLILFPQSSFAWSLNVPLCSVGSCYSCIRLQVSVVDTRLSNIHRSTYPPTNSNPHRTRLYTTFEELRVHFRKLGFHCCHYPFPFVQSFNQPHHDHSTTVVFSVVVLTFSPVYSLCKTASHSDVHTSPFSALISFISVYACVVACSQSLSVPCRSRRMQMFQTHLIELQRCRLRERACFGDVIPSETTTPAAKGRHHFVASFTWSVPWCIKASCMEGK